MLQPLVRRTWAPRGQTPVHRSWDRHDRLSVISAITVSPRRRRLRLHFEIHGDNIRAPQAIRFIHRIRRRLGGKKLLLVWDRLNVHRSAAKKLARGNGVAIDWLPPYAPDLNPTEAVWNHTKYVELANFIPADTTELAAHVATSLHFLRSEHDLLAAFFRHAGLYLMRAPRRSVVR
jgi:transposase